jgi:hypothetical protein
MKLYFIVFLLLQQSFVLAQYSIKTNLFSPISRLRSYDITIEKKLNEKNAISLTLGSIYLATNLDEQKFRNIQNYKLVSKMNPYLEIGYFFNKRWSFTAGYGYVNIDRKETYCKDPELIEGTQLHYCSDFITKQHEEKTKYIRLAPAVKIIDIGTKFTVDLTFKPTFSFSMNDYGVWENENIYSPDYKSRSKLKMIYDYNFFFKETSFYLIPEFELNVGYKI